MRIAVIGGGPAGLFFAALARRLDPRTEVTVWERNAPDDTFGFGVVLSARALGRVERADPELFAGLGREFVRWDDIQVRYRGTTTTAGGNRFAALSRAGLLAGLQRRCAGLGVPVHHGSEVTDVDALAAEHDLVVAADGAHSLVRARYADTFRPAVQLGRCRYLWLGTDRVLDSFTFAILDTPAGAAQVHAYPHSDRASTVILELSEHAWRRAGFAAGDLDPAGPDGGDEPAIEVIAELCRDVLAGHQVFGNKSRWLRFPTVRCDCWRHRNVVLVGDAAHTAHFSIGSGTHQALEDALALATSLHEQGGVPAALAAYEAGRRPAVLATQRAARASQEWFESVERYTRQEPTRFAVNILTRSRRVSYAGLRRRDPGFLARAEREFAASVAGRAGPPAAQPLRLDGLVVPNRVVVAPPERGPTGDGAPDDLLLVHLGGAALGGAGLVLTGPVAASGTGTAVPGDVTLATEEQVAGWRRAVRFVHAHTPARIGIQLGYYGRAGTSVDDLRRVFAAAARRAAAAGFDLLELDCAHGSRLARFLRPAAGEDPERHAAALPYRLRHPLGVLDAVRAAWPPDRPVGVRLSPAEWFPAGDGAAALLSAVDAVAARGAALVHLSTGTSADPAAYADRVRNRAGRPPGVAVLAGRADLCVVDAPAAGPAWVSPPVAPARPVPHPPVAYEGWRRDAPCR
ncbi:MAG TPA: FAD-dependent monooxygenase [Mycobacteriales bacterium]|nr:FAD-dependent monooxygenase [Mycobacteriales bacterium]